MSINNKFKFDSQAHAKACSQVIAELVKATSKFELISPQQAQTYLTKLEDANFENLSPFTTDSFTNVELPTQLDFLPSFGLDAQDYNANALLLVLKSCVKQYEELFAPLQEKLLAIADEHSSTLVVIKTKASNTRITSLGCLAYEWYAKLTQLQTQMQQLAQDTFVLRYQTESQSSLNAQAGAIMRLVAIELDLGVNLAKRVATDFVVQWAVWHMRMITFSASMLSVTSELSRENTQLKEILQALIQVCDQEGAKSIATLLRPVVANSSFEWVYLDKLVAMTFAAFTAMQASSSTNYDAKVLSEQSLGQGQLALTPAVLKLLQGKIDDDKAHSAIDEILTEMEQNGGQLLPKVTEKFPDYADEINQLGTPEGILGPIPAWVKAKVAKHTSKT